MAEVEPTMGRPYCKKQQESEQADERRPYEMTAHNFSLRACNRCYARYNELLSQGFLAAMPPRCHAHAGKRPSGRWALAPFTGRPGDMNSLLAKGGSSPPADHRDSRDLARETR